MYDNKDLVYDNDPVHADLVRAICSIEDAIKFLNAHESLKTFSNLLAIYLESMVAKAESLNDSLANDFSNANDGGK